jgi:drug/metabolite transporter (DMT)-like permease
MQCFCKTHRDSRIIAPFPTGTAPIDTETRKNVLTMLGGTFSLATMAALVHGLGEHYHWTFVVFIRISLTFFVALVAARILGVRPIIFGPKALWTRSIMGTIAMVCNFYALTHLTITDALTLLKTSPIWVSIIVAVLNRRMHSPTMWLAVAIGFAGVVVMEQPKFEGNAFPISVAVFSAFFIASAQVSMGYLRKIPTLNIVIHFSGCASLATLLIFLITDKSPSLDALAWQDARWLLVMAVFGTIGQVWITTSFRKGNPMLMALVGLSSIPLAALYDYIFWKNTLGIIETAGIGLITISIMLCSRETIRQQNGQSMENPK